MDNDDDPLSLSLNLCENDFLKIVDNFLPTRFRKTEKNLHEYDSLLTKLHEV